MKTAQEQIEHELQTYVNSALMPCPFAKLSTDYLHLGSTLGTDCIRRQLSDALDKFYPNPSVSILAIVPHEEPETHGKARRQAFLLRLDWDFLHIDRNVNDEEERKRLKRKRAEEHRLMINDGELYVGPHFMVGDCDLIGTTFNPLYHPDHSRYTPHSVHVVIRFDDFQGISTEKPELS